MSKIQNMSRRLEFTLDGEVWCFEISNSFDIWNLGFGISRLLEAFQIPLQTIRALFDILEGIGIGKAEVTLGIRTKIDAGRHAYLRLLQNVEGKSI